MKSSIAKISLIVAGVLFFTGFLVLCSCPGWYALASGFAGIAVWLGVGKIRKWAMVWLIFSLFITSLSLYSAMEDGRRHRFAERVKKREQERQQGTNIIEETHSR